MLKPEVGAERGLSHLVCRYEWPLNVSFLRCLGQQFGADF